MVLRKYCFSTLLQLKRYLYPLFLLIQALFAFFSYLPSQAHLHPLHPAQNLCLLCIVYYSKISASCFHLTIFIHIIFIKTPIIMHFHQTSIIISEISSLVWWTIVIPPNFRFLVNVMFICQPLASTLVRRPTQWRSQPYPHSLALLSLPLSRFLL